MDEARLTGIIAQDIAHLADSSVYAVLSVDENSGTPQTVYDFLPRDQMTVLFDQQDQ
ncbi:MAG TPA: hypothetical protein VEG30_06205 [Terriglobales bacterium]|nr:hypothetical protein [Terriglobales bacterium]